MTRLFFKQALIEDHWRDNVLIEVDQAGTIASIAPASTPADTDHFATIGLPGIPNVHSHAFQRAMAGLSESRQPGEDDFWAWRKIMYQFVDTLTPDDLCAIAALAYMEMLESGFTSVCEFHYLHHDPSGAPYNDLGAMALGLAEACEQSGIGITFLPVYYAQGGFGGKAPSEAQRRFINSPDRYAQLVERTRDIASSLADAHVGIAPHSLRAVTPKDLSLLLQAHPTGPVHIHIAEQIREVEDCLKWSSRRPVEWLFNHADVDERWCLVHATHLNDQERQQMAQSGCVAGLCPITEANLGDGIFDGVHFDQEGGTWAVGSDSNISINAAEELRLFEYSQRLRDKGRNRMSAPNKSTGRYLFDQACKGGAQASGRKVGKLAVGWRADMISLDEDHPGLLSQQGDGWLDGWVFAANRPAIKDVWVAGKQIIAEGRHIRHKQILTGYRESIRKLMA